MRVIDLTHTISIDMPVYPGTEQPTLEEANTYEINGFKETKISIYSHTPQAGYPFAGFDR